MNWSAGRSKNGEAWASDPTANGRENGGAAAGAEEAADHPRDLEALVNYASDLVVVITSDGRIGYINPSGRAYVGLDEDEDIALYWVWDFLPLAARKTVFRFMVPDLQGRGRWEGRVAIRTQDGEEIPMAVLVTRHSAPVGSESSRISIVGRPVAPEATARVDHGRDLCALLEVTAARDLGETSLHQLAQAVGDMLGAGTLPFQTESALPDSDAPGEEAVAGALRSRDPLPAEGRPLWEWRIRRALEVDEFTLVAQPIACAEDGTIAAYELLVRLVDERGRVHLPAAFLPVAESTGLISYIDKWVVDKAIGLIEEALPRGRTLVLEVNLSARSLGNRAVLTFITERLASSGIPAANLVLEITETAAIRDLDQARAFIDVLKAAGCRFALDDFGVGFGSFLHLKHLNVDFLKIDGSFIRGLRYDPIDRQMVRAFVDVAKALGIRTVAEFVPDERTVRLLRDLGVDYVQGYHIGKPGPLEAIRRG